MEGIEKYPRGTASHEAGHAVVAWALSIRVVAIHVRADDHSGGTQMSSTEHLSRIEKIAVHYAGYVAERVFDAKTHEHGPFDDRLMILNLLAEVPDNKHTAFKDAGYNLARTCIETHKNKVTNLAERLAERGHVDEAEFLNLMDGET